MDPIKALHFSDLHGRLPQIPIKYHNEETLIILSGDICDNYPDNWIFGIKQGIHIFTPTTNEHDIRRGLWNFRKIPGDKEGALQNEWIETKLIPHLQNCHISLDNVIVIRGNHDWCDFEKYFKNSANTETRNLVIRGLKIGLLCGVAPYTGEWQDEIGDFTFRERIAKLDPETEILVTHVPPYGIKDRSAHDGSHIGAQEVYTAIFGRSVFDVQPPYLNKLRFHLFGHCHDARGTERQEVNGREIRFYNAAQTRFELDLAPKV